MDMIKMKINGKTVSAAPGSTVLQAARENDIYIPTLCHFEGLEPRANCRICIVEVEGMRTFQPACATKIQAGMVVNTDTDAVRNARKSILQLILADHAVDCHHCMRIGSSKCDDLDPLFCEMCFWCDCPRDGFCELQTLAREYKVDVLPYTINADRYAADESLGSVIRNPNKCIKCRRCVDVCGEIQTVHNLSVKNRGTDMMVIPELGKPMAESVCVRCGRCVEVCPTGAIFMKEHIDEMIYQTHKYGITTVAQLDARVISKLEERYKLEAGTISTEQVITALHKVGIDYVVTDQYAKGVAFEEAVKAFGESSGQMIVTNSYAVKNFVDRYFPDMKESMISLDSPQKIFGDTVKNQFAKEKDLDPALIRTINVTVSNEECAEAAETGCVDFALNDRELYRMMLRTGGAPHLKRGTSPDTIGEIHPTPITETENFMDKGTADVLSLNISGKSITVAVANNLGQTRRLLEQVKEGNPTADIIWLRA